MGAAPSDMLFLCKHSLAWLAEVWNTCWCLSICYGRTQDAEDSTWRFLQVNLLIKYSSQYWIEPLLFVDNSKLIRLFQLDAYWATLGRPLRGIEDSTILKDSVFTIQHILCSVKLDAKFTAVFTTQIQCRKTCKVSLHFA